VTQEQFRIRQAMFSVLSWPKHRTGKAYRRGIIQMACLADAITHAEWQRLRDKVDAGVYPITHEMAEPEAKCPT